MSDTARTRWPDASATREEVDAFAKSRQQAEVGHEAPPMLNGPSIVCAACGTNRIKLFGGPFCSKCQAAMG